MKRSLLKKGIPALLALLLISMTTSCSLPAAATGDTGRAEGETGTPVSGWRTFLNDFERGNFAEATPGLPAGRAWKKNLRSFSLFKRRKTEFVNSPVIIDGVLYVGTKSRGFYAIDAAARKTLWRFKAGSPIDAPATADRNMVCFGTIGGRLHCLERGSGREFWSFESMSEIVSSPVFGDERVYFTSSDSRLYALDRFTGQRRWSYTHRTSRFVAPRLYASPAFAGGRLFTLFNDGYLVCIDAATGAELWKIKALRRNMALERARRTPLVSGGLVYLIDDRGDVVAFDVKTGGERKRYDMLNALDFTVTERAVVISDRGRIVSLDRSSGAILWKAALETGETYALSGAGGHLFVLSNFTRKRLGLKSLEKDYGRIAAYSMENGQELWKETLSSVVHANAAMGEGHIALITSRGTLYVFSAG